MAEPYRFGGPIPESVARLKSRRTFRASSLYARMKRANGDAFDRQRAAETTLPWLLGGQFPCPPAECPPAA